MEVLRAPCAFAGRTYVAELGFSCSLLKNPTLKDKCWVKRKIALLGKLVILGRSWMHVPGNQLPTVGQGAKGFKRGGFSRVWRQRRGLRAEHHLGVGCANLISTILITLGTVHL